MSSLGTCYRLFMRPSPAEPGGYDTCVKTFASDLSGPDVGMHYGSMECKKAADSMSGFDEYQLNDTLKNGILAVVLAREVACIETIKSDKNGEPFELSYIKKS